MNKTTIEGPKITSQCDESTAMHIHLQVLSGLCERAAWARKSNMVLGHVSKQEFDALDVAVTLAANKAQIFDEIVEREHLDGIRARRDALETVKAYEARAKQPAKKAARK